MRKTFGASSRAIVYCAVRIYKKRKVSRRATKEAPLRDKTLARNNSRRPAGSHIGTTISSEIFVLVWRDHIFERVGHFLKRL